MIVDLHLALATPADELDAYGRYLASRGLMKGWDSPSALVEGLDADGVDLGLILHGPAALREAFVDARPRRLRAFAPVSLRALARERDATLADARARIAAGFVGFGEITPYREGFNLDDPPLDTLLALACELDVPVHVECTCTLAGAAPGRVTTPIYDFEAVARRFPSLKLILGSWGGGLCLYEMMPELPAAMLNVYYDTTSPVDAFDVDVMLETVPKVVRYHKILYGSGSPLLPRDLAPFHAAAIPAEVRAGVLGRNARLLFKL